MICAEHDIRKSHTSHSWISIQLDILDREKW